MINDGDPPTVPDTMANAENFLILSDGSLMQLEDFLRPGYSGCNQCALRPRGNPTTIQINEETTEEQEIINPTYIPSKCTFYEQDRYCVLEEGMVIETVQTFSDGKNQMDILTLQPLLLSMLNQQRLARVGQVINFSNVHLNKEASDLVNKYISMTVAISNQVYKGLKEMLATRKDQTTLKMASTNAAKTIASNINKAVILEEAEAEAEEMEKDNNGSGTINS